MKDLASEYQNLEISEFWTDGEHASVFAKNIFTKKTLCVDVARLGTVHTWLAELNAESDDNAPLDKWDALYSHIE